MKSYCNMIENLCLDVFSIPDDVDLKDCLHPLVLPKYENNLVPSYVGSLWTLGEDGVWTDRFGVRWPNGIPEGPSFDDPNYHGPWPIPKEEPSDTPEE